MEKDCQRWQGCVLQQTAAGKEAEMRTFAPQALQGTEGCTCLREQHRIWKLRSACPPPPSPSHLNYPATFSTPPPRSPREEVAPSVTTYSISSRSLIESQPKTQPPISSHPDLERLWSHMRPARPPQKEYAKVLLRLNGFPALKLCVFHQFGELFASVVVEGSGTVEGLIAWDLESRV